MGGIVEVAEAVVVVWQLFLIHTLIYQDIS